MHEVAILPRGFYNFEITNGPITETEKLHSCLKSCVIEDFKNVHNFAVGQTNQNLLRPKANHNHVHKFIDIKWQKAKIKS